MEIIPKFMKEADLRIKKLLEDMENNIPYPDEDLRELAQKAIISLKERENENIEDWAQRLANDICVFTD